MSNMCDAKCGHAILDMKCGDAMWIDGVVHGEYQWWCAVMQDVKCGCGIPSVVEWCDAILDMVVSCGMIEMQCMPCAGLECVLG